MYNLEPAKRYAALGLAAILVGGVAACSPLQQAPLVYSSKSSFGVDLSATSTETPGISLNIGSKQVDSAYVPVAVALPCRGGLNQDMTACTGEQFKLLQVVGSSTLRNNSSPTALRLKHAQEEYQRAVTDSALAEAAVLSAQTALNKDQALAATKGKAQADRAALALDAATDVVAAADALVAEAVSAEGRLAEGTAALNRAKAALPVAKATEAATKGRYDEALSANNISNDTLRNDALSVFGTFDGSGETSVDATRKAGGSLTIGKMFSTGVASQVLAEGMRSVYATGCLERATAAVQVINAAVTDAAQKASVIAAIYGACQKSAEPSGVAH
ncbi:MAG: hypothetical protein KA744_04445 [Phenylobacterium sp.]|nr:hypothetical protein [Phenylobacterium sp.]